MTLVHQATPQSFAARGKPRVLLEIRSILRLGCSSMILVHRATLQNFVRHLELLVSPLSPESYRVKENWQNLLTCLQRIQPPVRLSIPKPE